MGWGLLCLAPQFVAFWFNSGKPRDAAMLISLYCIQVGGGGYRPPEGGGKIATLRDRWRNAVKIFDPNFSCLFNCKKRSI